MTTDSLFLDYRLTYLLRDANGTERTCAVSINFASRREAEAVADRTIGTTTRDGAEFVAYSVDYDPA